MNKQKSIKLEEFKEIETFEWTNENIYVITVDEK